MRPPRFRRYPVILLLALAGCSSTIGSKFGGNPQSRSIAVVGDRPLPATVGEPGGQVASSTAEPEPRRNPKARISGRVLDEAGKPVPDASVRLADGGSRGGRDVRARTDRSGAFTLGGLRPGSSYWLIAEVDDEKGARTGRVRAKTAETGVEISLGDQGDGSTPDGEPAARPPRARPISDREEVDGEKSRINEEDLLPPADEEEPGPPPVEKKGRTSGRPRLSAPEPSVGWRKRGDDAPATRQARHETDPMETGTADDSGADATRGRADEGAEDDGPNPLPPAIDAGRSRPGNDAMPAPRTKARRRPPPAADDSGGLTLPPDPEEAEAPAPRVRGPRRPKAEPGPPPMPSVDAAMGPSVESTGVFAAAPPSRLEPDEALIASSAPPGPEPEPAPARPATASPSTTGEAIALHDPPKAEAPPPTAAGPITIAATTPAPEPVFASPAATSAPEPSRDYNPFALVAQADPAPPPTVVVPATALAPEPPPVEEASIPAPTPARKTKWGDVAPASARPRTVAEAARPTSLFARFRPPAPARAKEPEKDATLALCDFDDAAHKLVDFRLPDLEGNPVRFQELDADYVLLDFWGTWCKPCLDSIPHLIGLQKQYGPRRLKVVGIACEKSTPEQRAAKVDAFARKLGINYTVLLSTMDGSCPVQKAMQVRYYPTMILLDRKGQVVWSASGATAANFQRLDRALASMNSGETARR